MEHPKYTLVLTKEHYYCFRIYEHTTTIGGGVMSREHSQYSDMHGAYIALSDLSTGPILLACSNQPIDNTVDVSRG